MGFVVENKDWGDAEEGEPSFSAFIFESNTEGEKVNRINSSFLFLRGGNVLSDAQMSIEVSLLSLFTDMLHHKLGEGHYRSKEGNGNILKSALKAKTHH